MWIMNNEDLTYLEIKKQMEEKSKNRNDSRLLWVVIIALMPFLCMWLVRKPHEYVANFANLGEPVQIETSWWTTIKANWDTVSVNFLAEYDISWRVLTTAQYWDGLLQRIFARDRLEDNIIRYKDVWMWWWVFTQDEYVKRFDWISFSRFLFPQWKSYDDYIYIKNNCSCDNIESFINTHMSHNHLIPANHHIKVLIRKIKKWDYIHIKWYLVELRWSWWYHLKSSLTREDTWDGACETIYVTDISWLREK